MPFSEPQFPQLYNGKKLKVYVCVVRDEVRCSAAVEYF